MWKTVEEWRKKKRGKESRVMIDTRTERPTKAVAALKAGDEETTESAA